MENRGISLNNSLIPEENAINLKDFVIVREFDSDKVYKGKRYLVSKKNSSKLFTMKKCRKTLIEPHKNELFSLQKQVFELNNPFLAKIQHLIENQSCLFVFQPFFSGLDLAFQVSQLGYFKEKIAKFYLAEMILALGNLPNNQVLSQSLEICLDLKLMLLDRDGHLSVNLMSPLLRNTKKMGSSLDERYNPPEFFTKSPEKNYDISAVLSWKLGIFLYEMLSGKKPFENSREILENDVKFSHEFPKNAVGLIRELLLKNPLLRLGNKGINELKNHEFFKEIPWSEMQEKKTIGPLALSSKMETRLYEKELLKENFTEKFIEENDENSMHFIDSDQETTDEKTKTYLSNVKEEDEEILVD